MYLKNKSESVINTKPGITSYALLDQSQEKVSNLLITWVEVAINGQQELHQHEAEQTYVVTNGYGIVTVGNEERKIGPGDLVYIPSNILHGIKNIGDSILVYISSATPSFDVTEFYKK